MSTAPLALQDVAGPGESSGGSNTSTMTETTPASASGTRGNSVGVEVLTPGVKSSGAAITGTAAGTAGTAGTGSGTAGDVSYGLHTAAPANTSALPPVEKAADAPDQVNEVAGKPQPTTAASNPNKKNPKPAFDKDAESSSTHKKKKGLAKLNPL